MEQYPALSETEEKLKDLYFAHPDLRWDKPVTEADLARMHKETGIDFDTMFPVPIDSSLSEDSFIPEEDDVAVIQHVRYMPALIHSHDFFELTYIYQGQGTNYMNDVVIPMTEGDLCLTPPHMKHALSAFSDNAVIINILIRSSTFDTAFLDLLSGRDVLTAFFTQALFSRQQCSALLFRTGNDTNLKEFITFAFEEYRDKERYHSRMLNNLIDAICVMVLRRHERDIVVPALNEDISDDNLIYILNYVQANFAHLTLTELAEFFHYSERHMSRLIKEYTGKRFSELVRDLKLHKAADLLRNPELAIPDIVEQIGYSDVSGFYRAFKTCYGETPVDFRKRLSLSEKAFPAEKTDIKPVL